MHDFLLPADAECGSGEGARGSRSRTGLMTGAAECGGGGRGRGKGRRQMGTGMQQ